MGLLVLLLLLMFGGSKERRFDERITLNRKEKSPYGLYAAHRLLPSLFNGAEMNVSRVAPEQWYDKKYVTYGQTLMFLVSRQFNPSKEELTFLNEFVKEGNIVFISTPAMNKLAKEYFQLKYDYDAENAAPALDYDSGKSSILSPPFLTQSSYFNPGFSYYSSFAATDTGYYQPLGKAKNSAVNFIRIKAGKGYFYFHSNPFLFANYFLLHQQNVHYLEEALSLPSPSISKIIWDEYYVYKSEDTDNTSPWPLRVLLKQQAFLWGFMLSLALLLLYVLLNMKRTQRLVPVYAKPANESLDFIKTMGRLYFNKKDHANLARKMAAFFWEGVRNKYFIQAANRDENVVKVLAGKSGYPEDKLTVLLKRVEAAQTAEAVTEQELGELYSLIEDFHKATA